MASSVNQSKIVIPTGFESQQRQLERKQAIAQALLERGLAGPGANATSWTQPLASIVQVLAGKHLQGRADKQQGALDTQIRGDYTGRVNAFNQKVLAAGNSIPDLQKLYLESSSDPMLQELVKPVMERVLAAQKSGDSPTDWGPYRTTNRDAMAAGRKPNDLNQGILTNPDGSGSINEASVTAALRKQNMQPPAGYTPISTVQDPLGDPAARLAAAQQGGITAPPAALLPPQPPAAPESGQELPALPGPQGMMPSPPDQAFKGPLQDHRWDPVGKRMIYKFNNQWYDNPEGR